MGYWDQEMTEAQRAQVHAAGVPTSVTYPRDPWIVSLDIHSVGVTEGELVMLRSFAEYEVRHVYTDTWIELILAEPLPRCDGHNTVVFVKRADGGWAYRRATWSLGPMYVPTWRDAPVSLVEAMDRSQLEWSTESWMRWKRERPDVFPDASNQT